MKALRFFSLSLSKLCKPGGTKLLSGLSLMIALIVILVVSTVLPKAETSFDKTRSSDSEKARLSEQVSVQASGRGNPWISLSDGRELITSYVGPQHLVDAIEQNLARPLSLASADFDEDGVADLVCGYEHEGRGIIALHRGNVDSIYPNSLEAQQRRAKGEFTDAPFLSPARVFASAESVDFIGAGDFDADGHWDVVVASRGSSKLNLLSGDGRGGLGEAEQIELPGAVTAMTVGEI
ncbi:MAG: VCBS repeat-containing protein, partial [Acidobacteriota bacterium]